VSGWCLRVVINVNVACAHVRDAYTASRDCSRFGDIASMVEWEAIEHTELIRTKVPVHSMFPSTAISHRSMFVRIRGATICIWATSGSNLVQANACTLYACSNLKISQLFRKRHNF
jgi:hypothetical protein